MQTFEDIFRNGSFGYTPAYDCDGKPLANGDVRVTVLGSDFQYIPMNLNRYELEEMIESLNVLLASFDMKKKIKSI